MNFIRQFGKEVLSLLSQGANALFFKADHDSCGTASDSYFYLLGLKTMNKWFFYLT
jgi:hypothetical protein